MGKLWGYLVLSSILVACSGKRLPPLLSDDVQFYRFMNEVELLENGKSFIQEEWASVVKQTFRMDLIEAPSGTRKTYLYDKSTEEKFFYKPYTCLLVSDNFSKSLDYNLLDYFPTNQSSFIPAGVGSLWFYGLKFEADYTAPKDVDLKKRGGGGASHTLRNYGRYKINQCVDYAYKLEFYFRPGLAEESRSLALIQILHCLSEKVLMRIKVLEVDVSWKATEIDSSDIFDLPTGYGCKRSQKFDPYLIEMPTYIKRNNFEPYLLRVNMIASQPMSSSNRTFDEWRTHTSSVSILTGRFELNDILTNDYLVLKQQDYASPEETPKVFGTDRKHAALRKVKQVWDLGEYGLKESLGRRAILFKQDEKNRICLVKGKNYLLNEYSNFELPLFPKTSKGARGDLISIINVDSILELFSANADYHLLSQKELHSDIAQTEYVYEKRRETFVVRDFLGNLDWFGPVSIVRRDLKHKSGRTFTYKTTITINFLAHDYSTLETRVVLELVEAEAVDRAYFHQELDVGLCLEGDINEVPSYPSSLSDGTSLEFSISYAHESGKISDDIASSDRAKVEIYNQFLKCLFDASNDQLDIMQVSDIAIDFGEETLKVSGKLLKKPNLLSYTETKGQKIVAVDGSKHLFTEIKSTSESCAESCNHYKCTGFFYCFKTNLCNLFLEDLNQISANGSNYSYQSDPDCSMFTPLLADKKMRHMEPSQLISNLRQSITESNYGTETDNGLDSEKKLNFPVNSLVLRINDCSSDQSSPEAKYELSPISIGSGESLDEQMTELGDEFLNSNTVHGELNLDSSKNKRLKVSARYRIMFENRKFQAPLSLDEKFPLQEAKHMSYDECELLCNEVDCRSFSHCVMEGKCLVSSLHQASLVERRSTSEGLCFILARDYITKFTRTLKTKPPNVDHMKTISAVLSVDECASSCMETDEFKCGSFYHCSGKKESTFDCYLSDSHNARQENDQAEDASCDFYTRSYLSEFDKFYGMSLPASSSDESESITVIKDIAAEDCALRCAIGEGQCWAFHVCRQEDAHKPVCVMMSMSSKTHDQNQEQKLLPLEPKHLIANQFCTAFILAKNSQLRNLLQEINSTVTVSDYTQQEGENFTHSKTVHNHSFLKIFLIILGVSAGYLVALVFDRRVKRLR